MKAFVTLKTTRAANRVRASLDKLRADLSAPQGKVPTDAESVRLLSGLADAMRHAQRLQALGVDVMHEVENARRVLETLEGLRLFRGACEPFSVKLAEHEKDLRRGIQALKALVARDTGPPPEVARWCVERLEVWADRAAAWQKELARPIELKVVLAARLEAITEAGVRVAFDEGPRLEVPFGAQGEEELRPFVGRPVFVSGSATFGPLGTVVSLREPRFAPEEHPLDLDRGLWDFVAANAPQIDFGDDE